VIPTARWAAFWVYAGLLFVGTHWPRLVVDSPVRGTDKFIHAAVFLLWTVLLAWASDACRGGWRLRTVGAVGCVYALVDEGLQAIPALGRTCSAADLLANLVGIGVAIVMLGIRSRVVAGHRATGSDAP